MSQLNRLPEDVLVRAETLRRNTQQERDIREIVINVVKSINDDIHAAHQKGRRETAVALPYTFNIPDMTNADCQRRVWATVIQIMVNAGYEVNIDFDAVQCQLHINWLSQQDKTNIAMFDALLRKHRVHAARADAPSSQKKEEARH